MMTRVKSDGHLYVPALKWKKGEQVALNELDDVVASRVAPLIELVPSETPLHTKAQKSKGEPAKQAKPAEEKCKTDIRLISKHWPGRISYIDPSLLVNRHGRRLFKETFEHTASLGLPVIPVVQLGGQHTYGKEAKAVHLRDGNGICVRAMVPMDTTVLRQGLESLLNTQGLNPQDVDVVIDASDVSQTSQSSWLYMNLPSMLHWLHSKQFRNLIVLGGSMPKSLANQPVGESDTLRHEWTIFQHISGSSSKDTQSDFVFGDYAINSPVYSHAPVGGPPNIRYTEETRHLISKGLNTGARLANGDPVSKFHQLHDMAKQLIKHASWQGKDYCAGDLFIHEVAGRSDKPGNHTNWRTAGTNHHMTFVVNQLNRVTSPSASVLRLP